MQQGYINNLSLISNPFQGASNISSPFSTSSALGSSGRSAFQDVLTNTIGQVNQLAAKPDHMLMESVTNGTYDIHDVMMASAKAELAITVTAQMTTKIVQAYDKILQIQV